MRRRSCAAGRRPGTGRGRGRRRRARPGRRARRARRPRTRTPPGGSGWRGAPGRAGPGSPRAGTAAPRRPPCWRAGPRGAGGAAGRAGADAGQRPADALARARRCRPGPVPASPRRGASHWASVRYPGAAASRKACGRPAPMPRRRASIAASISALAAGGALRYRASSSGAPARNWITCPVRRRPGRQRQPRICRPGELAHLRRGERGGHGDVVPGQQLPRLRVRVLPAGRAGGQGVPVLGPQRGQHQHRGPAGVAQQLPQPGGDPLAQPGLGRGRGRTGPRSATPRSAARCPAARRSAASGRVGSIGCHSRHGGSWSRSRASASQQARVLPVEDPPTSTAIPLRPPAAARTTWPSTSSCSRGTYGGRTGSPGGASSGCTGRCTSSANGSASPLTGWPGAPGLGAWRRQPRPAAPIPEAPGRLARPAGQHLGDCIDLGGVAGQRLALRPVVHRGRGHVGGPAEPGLGQAGAGASPRPPPTAAPGGPARPSPARGRRADGTACPPLPASRPADGTGSSGPPALASRVTAPAASGSGPDLFTSPPVGLARARPPGPATSR